jgi:hypothetical protein
MTAAKLADAPHDTDVLTQPADSVSDKAADLRAFEMALERFAVARPGESLFRVLATGPLPPEDAAQYAAVYSRGMVEIGKLLMPGRCDGNSKD